MERPATLEDVAARAQVSGKTVSRVANGHPHVSARTRERVEQVIAELGFSLNPTARALATQRSHLIGALSRNIASYYVDQVHQGGAEACRVAGYKLAVQAVDIDDAEQVEELERSLRTRPFDGAILMPPLTDDARVLAMLERQAIRYVRLTPLTEQPQGRAVFADDAAGMDAALDHLWRHGHRRFGVVEGLSRHLATRVRRNAVLTGVGRRGGDASAVRIVRPGEGVLAEVIAEGSGNRAVRAGFEAAAQLLADPADAPTAIFAFNDEVAAGVLGFAHDRGLRVPRDLSVVGFDDGPIALITWPPLTTVRQPIAAMAQRAAEWLIAPPGAGPLSVTLPVELVVRASTGPAPTPPRSR